MTNTIDYGIDLGTTNSAIARQEGARSVLLPGEAGDVLLPSVLHIRADGTRLTGRAARAFAEEDPKNTAVEFKRLMGTDQRRAFPASGIELLPEEMAAEALRALLRRTPPGGEPVRAAVITVPAMFQLPQCEATIRAARLAGIEHAPLLQEPIAAAIAHAGMAQTSDGYWLVYDLGGGTFDVSLVRSRAGRLQVLDHDGDNHLGGRDFDRVVARRAAEIVREEGRHGAFARADPDNADAYSRLKLEAERVRIALSTSESTTFQVENLVQFTLEREELDRLIQPFVSRTIDICRKLLSRQRINTTELSGIVLVGGPTRTLLVPRLIHETLQVDAAHRLDPMTIVASGAALFASTQKLPAALRAGNRNAAALTVDVEYEAMTTDPRPLLVVRATPAAAAVGGTCNIAGDSGYDSGALRLDARGTAAATVRLAPNTLNRFSVRVEAPDGQTATTELAILHGLSVAKPPLSQSVGVMLAGNQTRWYLRKGATLPARNTMVHSTTIGIVRGQAGEAIHVPIVQGESERADRNKVIGILRIRAEALARDLPAGSEVEVHVLVDDSSHTSARAYVPLLDQWFDEVALFLMESKAGDAVQAGLAAQKDRLTKLAEMADEMEASGGEDMDTRVKEIEDLLEESDRDSIDLADQMVRRMTEALDVAETVSRRKTMETEFETLATRALAIQKDYGTASDKKEIEALIEEFHAALLRDDLDLAQTKLAALDEIDNRLVWSVPGQWVATFRWMSGRLDELQLAEKNRLVIQRGAQAIRESDLPGLRAVCRELYFALPRDARSNEVESIVSHII